MSTIVTSDPCPHWPDGRHTPIKLYRRPWRRLWRREDFAICVICSTRSEAIVELAPEAPT